MKPGKRYPSSTDVARAAGVSQSAVSRAFAEKSVSEETSRKVFEAAKKLGYSPNFIPRILLKHRSQLVAVVISGTSNPFYALALEEFTKGTSGDRASGAPGACGKRSCARRHRAEARELPRRCDRQRAAGPFEGGGAGVRRRADPDHFVQHAGQEPLGHVGLFRRRRRSERDCRPPRQARREIVRVHRRRRTQPREQRAPAWLSGQVARARVHAASRSRKATSSTRVGSMPRLPCRSAARFRMRSSAPTT